MLYILYGHKFWARKKLSEFLTTAREKGDEIFRLKSDSSQALASFLSSALFANKICLAGESLLENPDYEAELKELSGNLAASEHLIFLLEEELSKKWEEFFKKAGAKLEKFKNPSFEKLLAWAAQEAGKLEAKVSNQDLRILIEEAGEDPWAVLTKLERISLEEARPVRGSASNREPNYFQFTDLTGAKSKYQALRLLRSYVRDGFGAEEAFWRLWWKVKTLRMVDAGAKDHGLHPFVLKKAKEDLRNFSSEELKKLSYELMDIFSEVRRGEESFEEGLERVLLKL